MAISLTKEEINSKKFIFISYSHKDKAIVDLDVEKLNKMGVNLWYDEDMESGDNWVHRAQEALQHTNCVGAVFYSTPASFLSSPVHDERTWANEKLEELGDKFFIISINPNGRDTNHLIKDMYNYVGITDDNLNDKIKLEWITLITKIFDSRILFVPRYDDPTDALNRIYEKAKKYSATDDVNHALKKLANSGSSTNIDGNYVLKLGSYKSEKANLPASVMYGKTGRIIYDGIDYIIDDNVAYSVKPIEWNVVKNTNGIAVFVSNYILDICSGSNVDGFIQNELLEIAFNAKEKDLIDKIDLLSINDLDNIKCISKSINKSLDDDSNLWWLNESSTSSSKRYTADETNDTYQYKKSFTAGVRPVIYIKITDLLKYMEV